MPNFRYKAVTRSGALVTGTLEAPSQEAVVQQLRSLGHYPLSAAEAVAQGWRAWLNPEVFARPGASRRALAFATHELAALLQAGLPLDRSIEIVAGLGQVRPVREPLARALARVRDGASLAEALAPEPGFPRSYVAMVRAGEMGGGLDGALQRLAEYLAKAQAVREAVTSALVYPAILLIAALLSLTVILVFVLPAFEPLFANAGKTLPPSTQFVMGVSRFVGRDGWMLALAGLFGALWLRRALKRDGFRRRWDGAMLRLPLLGSLLLSIETERLSRVLGTLIGNGIPLPAALAITRDTLANRVVAGAVGETAVSLREGDAFSERLARTGVFPAIALDLIRIGEETGKLEEMLLRQADLAEQEVRHTVDRLLAVLVPGLTVFLGIIVAGIIASMLTAILSINDLALQ